MKTRKLRENMELSNSLESAGVVSQTRFLSEPFLAALKNGVLSPVLKRVQKDSSLCLDIRQEYINIYYRGGNIMRVGKDLRGYIAHFDKKYCSGNRCEAIEQLLNNTRLDSNGSVECWVQTFPLLKQVMDFWFAMHPKEEREFQQLVVRENNGAGIGNATDYFIVDIEYDNHKGARFDLVAIEWESGGAIRKLPKWYRPKLCFIEKKYGDSALSGKAGLVGHIEAFKMYYECDRNLTMIKNEMLAVFDQKRQLQLIPALKNNKNSITRVADRVDYVLLLANHDPASNSLKNALQKLINCYGDGDLGFDIKICCSNFMGYGIFKENIFSLREFMSRFENQI